MKSIPIYPLIMVLSLLLVSCAGETDTPNGPADTGQDAGTVDTEGDATVPEGDGGQGADTSTPDLDCVDGDTGAVIDGWCLIDGLCVEEGEANPDAPCQVCNPDGATDGWTAAADDTLCTVDTEDGEADGTCQGGLCVPDEDTTVDCDCEGESACCDGCNVINVGEDCGDGDLPCTANTCTETGVCVQTVLDGWCLTGHGTEEDPHLCADLATDSAHCGACDQACDHDYHCEGGECVRTCELELDLCNGECVDLQTDESHCGACDSPCTEETVCHGGECIIPVEEVLMEPEELHLTAGSTGSFTVTITPEDATHQTITWESEDTDVATVNEEGVITALTKGETTITATAGGKSARGLVTVTVSVEGVSIEPPALTLLVGEEGVLTPLFDPPNADDQRVTWHSDDEGVVLVNENGAVTGLTPGEVIITVTAADGGFIATCLVTVVIMPVDSVEVTPADATIEVDYTISLTPTVAPANATDQTVTWSTSDQDVATVDETGLVTGVSAGVAEITATTVCGGHTDTATITVLQPVTGVELSPERLLIPINSTGQFNLTVLPSDASNKDVTWLSDNWAVASIGGTTGLITGLQEGEATITVFTHDGDFQTEATVQVYIPVSGITIDQSSLVIAPEETGALTATMAPEDATFTEVFWESLDESIATVDQDGVVTAVGVGTATIRVWTEDGDFSDTTTVTVRIPLEQVGFDPDNVLVPLEGTSILTLVFTPEDATMGQISWESLDETVATVDQDGVVTGLAIGTATIQTTVTTVDGSYSADCTVTVDRHMWARAITATMETQIKAVKQDPEGNIYVTGSYRGSITFDDDHTFTNRGDYDGFVAKYDADGQLIWADTYGGNSREWSKGLALDSAGNVTVTGSTSSLAFNIGGKRINTVRNEDIFIAQWDGDGEYKWTKIFGTLNYEAGDDIATDGDDNIYVFGTYSTDSLNLGGGNLPHTGGTNQFLVKLDSNGNYLWDKAFIDSNNYNLGYEGLVSTDSEGNVFAGGHFYRELIVDGVTLIDEEERGSPYLVKYDGEGNRLWAKVYNSVMGGEVQALAVDTSGNIHLTGSYLNSINWGGGASLPYGYDSVYLARLGGDGNHIWSKGGLSDERAKGQGIAVDQDGKVYLSGRYQWHLNLGGKEVNMDDDTYHGFAGVFSNTGEHLWSAHYQSDLGTRTEGGPVAADNNGRVIFTGRFQDQITFGGLTLQTPSPGAFVVKIDTNN